MQRMEEQVKILNKYIRELAKENEMLQDKNNDMRTTLTQNKQLLGTRPPSRLLQEYRRLHQQHRGERPGCNQAEGGGGRPKEGEQAEGRPD
jgi:predicted RNase H-like nuclease (RuvC/YqgF family)